MTTTEKKKLGRKPRAKPWDVQQLHGFRTDYKVDSAIHILMYLAGDQSSQLISVALREFAASRCIPIDDTALQHSVFMQAAAMQASNKRPPLPSEVIEALGQNSVLDKLNSALGLSESLTATTPRLPASTPVTPAFAPRPVPATISAQVSPKPAPTLPSAPAHAPVASSTPQLQVQTPVATAAAQCKPPPNIDMGPDIDLAPPPAEEATGNSLKNRWLATHDY